MKKLFLLCPLLTLLAFSSFAQWLPTPGNGNNIYNTNSGLVGIGTSSPTDKLTVVSGTASGGVTIVANTSNTSIFSGGHALSCNSSQFTGGVGISMGANNTGLIQAWSPTLENGTLLLDPNGGNVGIGTTSPTNTLSIVTGTNPGGVSIVANTANNSIFNGGHALQCTSSQFTGGLGISVGANNSGLIQAWSPSAENGNLFLNPNGGSVGIGTTSPQGYELAVNGAAICTQMVVKPYANWPDYVFTKTYIPMPLDTLSRFIEANNHLPGMPAAAEIKKDGQDLGKIQELQMQKIEELTLYVIQLQKEIEALKAQLHK